MAARSIWIWKVAIWYMDWGVLEMLGMLGVMGVREEVERMGIMGRIERKGTLHGMQWL